MSETTNSQAIAGQPNGIVLRLAKRIQFIEHGERHTWQTCAQSARDRALLQAYAVVDELAKINSERRAGWRLFLCEECGRAWWRATRDRFSPSVEGCMCGEDVRPVDNRRDVLLAVDEFGNLRELPCDLVLREAW